MYRQEISSLRQTSCGQPKPFGKTGPQGQFESRKMAPGNWQATSSMEPLALCAGRELYELFSKGQHTASRAAWLLEPLLLQNRPGDRWAAWTV